jgi:hypothetical protein
MVVFMVRYPPIHDPVYADNGRNSDDGSPVVKVLGGDFKLGLRVAYQARKKPAACARISGLSLLRKLNVC